MIKGMMLALAAVLAAGYAQPSHACVQMDEQAEDNAAEEQPADDGAKKPTKKAAKAKAKDVKKTSAKKKGAAVEK